MRSRRNIYESDRLLAEYLLFHYGTDMEILPFDFGPKEALHFPERCVQLCLESYSRPRVERALDLGCAVGRATFELARFCEKTVGIDRSVRFIAAANALKEKGSLNHANRQEGEIGVPARAIVPPEIERERATFEHGDACKLRTDLGAFDLVLMANLIDRLPQPRSCLQRTPSLVRPGGILMITSPYTWLEEFTARKHWLGGIERHGKPTRTLDSLKLILKRDFSLVVRKDLPFLIREHARKFQWGVAEATVWKRNPTK